MPGFPPTRQSMIERLTSADAQDRRAALTDLAEGYWKPLYKYLRLHWHLSADDAQDLTQSFFSEAIQKEWLARFDPAKARFRTFVRLCADRFVMNTRQSAGRLKRGGGVDTLSMQFFEAETELARYGLTVAPEADDLFQREFVRALFDRTLDRVRAEYTSAGRTIHLALFERYDIDPRPDTSYDTLAQEFGLTAAQVTNWLSQVRRSFRTHALDMLGTLCGSRDDFRREARDLFGLEIE